MQQKQIQRQSDKDIAKAIGIYLVVTGHLLNEQAVLGHALIYMVHMPLFSGSADISCMGRCSGIRFQKMYGVKSERF